MTGDALVFIGGAFTQLNGDELVTLVRGTQLERKVVKQLSLVHCDDDLSIVLFRQETDKGSELRDMHLVHRLHRVVKHKTRDDRLDREVEREDNDSAAVFRLPADSIICGGPLVSPSR